MTTIILTDAMIDHLIGARDRITDRTDEFIDLRAVDHIDAVLREVPAGDRPDVDVLLGRNIRTGWLSDTERGAVVEQAREDVAEAAAAKMVEYHDWQHVQRGEGCAGNSADEYDSSTEGRWA